MASFDLQPINNFLQCKTSSSWIKTALENLDTLLIDHAHCEKKAASSAINFLFRYPDRSELIYHMSRLAREELRHFEQVLALLKKKNINFCYLTPSPYAHYLQSIITTHEPLRLVDSLIVGAVIEARSCERFAVLAPHLEPTLQDFYENLLAAEARHFEIYLKLAALYSPSPIEKRIKEITAHEALFIQKNDTQCRFHSGAPKLQSVHKNPE